jgi:hypothetical protein
MPRITRTIPLTSFQEHKNRVKERLAAEGMKTIASYVAEGEAIRTNMARLRALRLAKEAPDEHPPEFSQNETEGR